MQVSIAGINKQSNALEALTEKKKLEILKAIMKKRFETCGIDEIDEMDGKDFEKRLFYLFKHLGYQGKLTPASADQGADLILSKGNEKIAVQAKRYQGSVDNSAVQQVVGAKHYYHCDKSWVVTTSTFTQSAKQLAKATGTVLFDRKELINLLDKEAEIFNSSDLL